MFIEKPVPIVARGPGAQSKNCSPATEIQAFRVALDQLVNIAVCAWRADVGQMRTNASGAGVTFLLTMPRFRRSGQRRTKSSTSPCALGGRTVVKCGQKLAVRVLPYFPNAACPSKCQLVGTARQMLGNWLARHGSPIAFCWEFAWQVGLRGMGGCACACMPTK